MKRKKMLEALSMADDKYIDEAAPNASVGKTKKRSRGFKLLIIAASFALVIAATCMWLFIPYLDKPKAPDIDEEELGEYYEIAQKLNMYFYGNGYYTTNFDKFFGGMAKDDATNGNAEIEIGGNTSRPMMPSPEGAVNDSAVSDSNNSATGSGQTYEETTDNQVEGVIEADIIKRSDKYIYYIDKSKRTVRVYSIEGEASALVGSFDLGKSEDHYLNIEGYLSEDCETLTLVGRHAKYDQTKRMTVYRVILTSLDVSNPENITLNTSVTVSGRYITSRMVDGELLLLTTFDVYHKTDFSDPEDYVPQIDMGDKQECISADSIIYPDKLSASSYSVICKFNEKELTPIDTMAFLSYTDTTYVSLDSAYVSRRIYHNSKSITGVEESGTLSEICRVGYKGDSFVYSGSVTVDGYLKDQYSLDEHEGILRVVTTTDRVKTKIEPSKEIATLSQGRNASLYCVDINSMEIVSKVENFAPWGETVRSVRFDGDTAYVCTAIQLSDPVFFFDLSDINNITYKHTGTIEGFSSSLVNFGEGYLLGIGQGNSWDTAKIEIYEESETGVVSVCKFEMRLSYFSSDYKSYFIDRENKMIGLGVQTFLYDNQYGDIYYMLFEFNEETEKLDTVICSEFGTDPTNMRADYIDGYFYMFCDDQFAVKKIAQ